ncbi:MAG: SUMF1/EgtB/PvdO family nonheme iron enzyme [Saprospiraceae bacterium]|nr:SUMF1/EgtB/PvdO family nonheme iron enzyme [Saprospiraceae bacterium]
MKHLYLFLLVPLGAVALAVFSCTLEKEPDIPAGATNEKDPVFAASEVTPDTGNYFQVTARLSSPGNLNILAHGWVWSDTPEPTLQDDNLDLGDLTSDTFSTKTPTLEIGKIYYLRPFVTTGMGTFYGAEHCSFLGVRFSLNTDTEIFQGARVQFTNHSKGGNYTFLWDFGGGSTSTEASPPVHIFNTPGNAPVLLTTELGNCKITTTIMLKVVPDPFQGYWTSIPGGAFMMGCTEDQDTTDEAMCYEDESPLHQVTIAPFFMGRTEITQSQWKAVMGINPSGNVCLPDCPVESVSWDTVVHVFIPALSRKTGLKYRLPTEAEWEYAAYGGEFTKYAGSNDIDTVGWYYANSGEMSHPVARKKANGYGLYDMCGNLWEWVEDDWHVGYIGAPADGSAWVDSPRGAERVFRGGSWQHDPEICRPFTRFKYPSGDKDLAIGFRLVRY